MTVQVIKLYSDSCQACKATSESLWQILQYDFPEVDFIKKRIVKEEKLYRRLDDIEVLWGDIFYQKCGVPVEEDPTLSEEEKEKKLAEGEKETFGLPTFIIRKRERPFYYEIFSGGVGEDHTIEDDEEFLKDFRKVIMKWLAREQGLKFKSWYYNKLFT